MRYRKLLLGSILCLFFAGMPVKSFSQCEPDTINCKDIGEPGQICPAFLPDGFLGSPYEEFITIIAPDSAKLQQGSIGLFKIQLQSIENLPPGIEFISEITEFFPNEYYCVTLSGTPTEIGTYHLKVSVIPFIKLGEYAVSLPVQTDSTSVSLTIMPSSSVINLGKASFSLIPAYPNPFSTVAKIGFIQQSPGETELNVYDILGQRIHREMKMGSEGENYFDFNGRELPPGSYFYSVAREGNPLVGKLVKLE